MKYGILAFLLILAAFRSPEICAQQKPENACYINNGRIYFQLDKRWSVKEKKEISTLFSLDSTLIELAFKGNQTFIYDSVTWDVSKIDANLVELSKQMEENKTSYRPNDVFLVDESVFIKPFIINPVFSTPNRYGINKFAKVTSVQYEGDTARFSLPGFPKAEQVYISGTFNNWSTMQHPMQKNANDWIINIRLSPGRYLYKFIVDGRWLHDPNNQSKEDDGEAGYNSILYCYNHVFRLRGYANAKKVFVTGSFNGWKKKELQMNRVTDGWELPVYLEEGTHAYKFIVDGTWINDPDNKIVRSDANGNLNSFMGIGDTLVFRLKGYTSANTVLLSGSFNGWSTNELVMNKTADGWELPYVLAAGNYEYKFIVDGKWMPDPDNPATTGTGEFINSCLTFKPNYTFVLSQFTEAKTVFVTGSFNGWREDGYQMFQKDGMWTLPVSLKPGKYTYKFIVDGRWLIDPANEYWEENEYGTGNSVLWIEP
jgi:hypothetical protein